MLNMRCLDSPYDIWKKMCSKQEILVEGDFTNFTYTIKESINQNIMRKLCEAGEIISAISEGINRPIIIGMLPIEFYLLTSFDTRHIEIYHRPLSMKNKNMEKLGYKLIGGSWHADNKFPVRFFEYAGLEKELSGFELYTNEVLIKNSEIKIPGIADMILEILTQEEYCEKELELCVSIIMAHHGAIDWEYIETMCPEEKLAVYRSYKQQAEGFLLRKAKTYF